jgi:hypothetical protein
VTDLVVISLDVDADEAIFIDHCASSELISVGINRNARRNLTR